MIEKTDETDWKSKAAPWVLPVALTAVALAWSVYAIGDLLQQQANPAFAYTTAALYDAVWLYALVLEAAHRRQGSKATLPVVIGWVFLPATVAVLVGHGLTETDWLAAAVGAAVPILAKVTLLMAINRERTRISSDAQEAIDRIRATTRDRVALTRAVHAARAEEAKAAAEIEKATREADAEALEVTHKAREAYAKVAKEHPMPGDAETLPGLISDADLEALLAGGMPDSITAGGRGGFELPGRAAGTDSGRALERGPADAAKEANDRAVALLAAELYATDPPPSLTQFRKAMRAEMNARNLTGSWATVDELYRREKELREGADATDA